MADEHDEYWEFLSCILPEDICSNLKKEKVIDFNSFNNLLSCTKVV